MSNGQPSGFCVLMDGYRGKTYLALWSCITLMARRITRTYIRFTRLTVEWKHLTSPKTPHG